MRREKRNVKIIRVNNTLWLISDWSRYASVCLCRKKKKIAKKDSKVVRLYAFSRDIRISCTQIHFSFFTDEMCICHTTATNLASSLVFFFFSFYSLHRLRDLTDSFLLLAKYFIYYIFSNWSSDFILWFYLVRKLEM